MSPDEPAEFTTRFRLTRADARAALWFAARDWLGWFIGAALLTLVCAIWPALGNAGRVAALVVPAATVLKMLSLLHQSTKVADRYCDRDLVLTLGREGVGFDSGLTQSRIRWAAIRRIVRGPAIWLFDMRSGQPFLVPAAAIPVEARALIARWAGESGVQLF
jgi:hypothetical protein